MIQQQEGHSRAFSGHCECSLHCMNARFWSSSILRILSLQKIWNSPSKYLSFKFNKQNEKVSVGVVTLLSILGSLAPSSRITAGKVCRVCNTKMIFCVKEVWLVFAGSVTFPSTTLTRSRSSFCSAAGPGGCETSPMKVQQNFVVIFKRFLSVKVPEEDTCVL